MRDHPRVSACLTFDFDALSLWIGSFGADSPGVLSRGEFGAVAVPRILDLLDRHRVGATFFVPGHTVLAYPDVVRRIRDAGHELGHHGWVHEDPRRFDRDGERRNLERGLEALDRVAGVRPRGYRSPAWDVSEHSVDLLLGLGFAYDSSCMGDDLHPHYLRTGDRVSSTEPYVFGDAVDLVEVPVTWGSDDFPPFEFVLGTNAGLASPSAVEEIWRGDFDYAYRRAAGSAYTLTMHPQVIGRGHRILMLERLVTHIAVGSGGPDAPEGLRIERVTDAHGVDDWCRIAVEGSPLDDVAPYRSGDLLDERILDDDRWRFYVGHADGGPVCIGTLFVAYGLGHFFLAVTRPDARGRGYYRAMARHRMSAADLPLAAVFSNMSRPVAEAHLGFLPITRFTLWRMSRPCPPRPTRVP